VDSYCSSLSNSENSSPSCSPRALNLESFGYSVANPLLSQSTDMQRRLNDDDDESMNASSGGISGTENPKQTLREQVMMQNARSEWQDMSSQITLVDEKGVVSELNENRGVRRASLAKEKKEPEMEKEKEFATSLKDFERDYLTSSSPAIASGMAERVTIGKLATPMLIRSDSDAGESTTHSSISGIGENNSATVETASKARKLLTPLPLSSLTQNTTTAASFSSAMTTHTPPPKSKGLSEHLATPQKSMLHVPPSPRRHSTAMLESLSSSCGEREKSAREAAIASANAKAYASSPPPTTVTFSSGTIGTATPPNSARGGGKDDMSRAAFLELAMKSDISSNSSANITNEYDSIRAKTGRGESGTSGQSSKVAKSQCDMKVSGSIGATNSNSRLLSANSAKSSGGRSKVRVVIL
jgi:hypothetical protein